MTNTIKPRIVMVDNADNIIGYKERGPLGKDDIYRVSALWIVNSKDEILLAKRHRSKKHHPGKWGPAVAGTVDEGETYELNITKEAEEELGLKNIKFELGPKTETNVEYHHFTQWYTLTLDKDPKDFQLQVDEVEEVKWFNPKDLEKQIQKHPENFLPTLETYVNYFKKESVNL